MKRHTLRAIVLAIVTIAMTVPANAGWKYVNFNMYTQGGNPPSGTVDYNVHFWLLWQRYQSHFTMYKVVNNMRVYVTVFGASYAGFKQQTVDWNAGDADPPTPFDPAAGFGSPGTISWTNDELTDGSDDDVITFYMWCADFFRETYGHPLRVSVLVAPHPDRKYGPSPDVNIIVNNGVIESAKVVYPRLPTRGQDVVDVEGDLGHVYVMCGDYNLDVSDFNNGAIGWIGALHVGGGILGGSDGVNEDEVSGWQGLLHLISRARRHRKIGLLQGGSMDGLIASGGRMTRIFTDNGLGAPVAPGMPEASAPEIGAGWQIQYDNNGPVARSTPFGIGRVIMKRGGKDARVTAGSDPEGTAAADWDFQGKIKKIVCNDKGGGANTGVDSCTFVTLGIPKVGGTAAIVNSTVETPTESIDLSTL